MTFKRQLMNTNKKPRRINKNAGGRKKNPMAEILRTPLYKSKSKFNWIGIWYHMDTILKSQNLGFILFLKE